MADPEISVLQRNSQWADRFGGATTNLAQRKRYAQDQEAYAEDLLGQQQRSIVNEARTNKTAQDFYFRQQELIRKRENDRAKSLMDHRKMEFEDQMNPLRLKAEEARQRASEALETSRLNKETRDAEQTLKVARDTDAFESGIDDMLRSNVLPGSEEFARGALSLSTKHPFVPPALRKDVFAQAKIQKDPNELMAEVSGMEKTHDFTVSGSPNGWTVSARPKPLPKADAATKAARPDTFKDFNKELGEMVNSYGGKANVPAERWAEFEKRKAAIGTTPAPVAPAPTADVNIPAAGSETPMAVAPALKAMNDDIMASARAAISAGKDAQAVANRLKENGYDPSGL